MSISPLPRFSLLLLGIMLCALTACSDRNPVRIGFMAGLSGRTADLGVAGRNGAMLAVEQKNAGGGINGRQIELVAKDDEQNDEVAKKQVTDLIAQKIELIIGPMTSSIAAAIMPQINASQTILLSPTVTTTQLTGIDDNFLRVIADTRSYAYKSANYHYGIKGYRNVAVILDQGNRNYTESWLRDFRSEFERLGGRIQTTVPFRSGNNTTFLDPTKQLLAARPDAVLIIANAVDAALICQQIRKLSATQPIIAVEWASTERFIELAGSAAEGVHLAQFINRNDRSLRYVGFVKAYRERFGGQEPGFAGTAGYDAALVAIEALEQRTKGTSLKQTILNRARFSGVQQTITLDRFGDADRKNFTTVVRNGTFVTIE